MVGFTVYTGAAMDESLVIPDYANWVVAEARHDCEQHKLKLAVGNAPPSGNLEAAIIERNGESSPPGTPIQSGGIVSVVIYPLEPRQ